MGIGGLFCVRPLYDGGEIHPAGCGKAKAPDFSGAF
jgi:hypothetical protein